MIKRIKNKIKHHFSEVSKIKTSPESIALGFAVGTFIAILPTFGLGIFIGLLVVLVFEKVSKISLIAAFAVFNPAIEFTLYALNYSIGYSILAGKELPEATVDIYNNLFIYTQRLFVGSVITATILALISYFLIYYAVKSYQKRFLTELMEEYKSQ